MKINSQEADRRYWIWLSSFEDISPRIFYALIARLGSAEAVFKEKNLDRLGILSASQLSKLGKLNNEDALDRLSERFERARCNCVPLFDEAYPALLGQIYDPPPTLFTRGNGKLPNDMLIGIVGSRKCTPEGAQSARKIAEDLAFYGVTVISGMARGIDSMANEGALMAGGVTAAVLGGGVDVIYPPEKHELYERIQEKGLIISEYIPGTRPLKHHFPARNRIISGMSHGLLLVEGSEGSGSMITVDFALEQGREVFAMPGNVVVPQSQWPNRLLRDGAHLAICAEDILNEFGWCEERIKHEPQKESRVTVELTEDEAIIASELRKAAMTVDELVEATGFTAQRCNTVLTLMELRRIIKELPGNRYSLAT